MALPLFSFFCLFIGLIRAGVHHEGGHKDPTWTKICLTGKKQSPINIVTSHAICHNDTLVLHFENFQNGTVVVWNTGETGVVEGFENWENRPIFVRTELRMKYFLKQIHFHWDMDDHGSEHAIDGRQATAEMHMVFTFGDMSVTKAKNISNGLVVVGILLNVVPGEKLGIYEDLIKIENTNDTKFEDFDFDLSTKIPKNADYFRYDGSLTTPDCEENVHWIVFKNPMGMSERELGALRHMHDKEKFIIEHNNRPPMNINGRKIGLYSPNCKQ